MGQRLNLLFLTLLILSNSSFGQTNGIKVYLYHTQPPFLIQSQNKEIGLHSEIIKLLNETQKSMHFSFEARPRLRLDFEIQEWIDGKCPGAQSCDSDWILMWVSPLFGWGKTPEKRFLWEPLFNGQDILVSRKSVKIDLKNPRIMRGKVYAAVIGRQPPEVIDKLIKDGVVKRDDGIDQAIVLERISMGRADFGMVPKVTVDYLIANDEKIRKASSSLDLQPLRDVTMSAMIPSNRADLKLAIEAIKKTEKWKAIVKKYRLQ